jgi:hypothetical protein
MKDNNIESTKKDFLSFCAQDWAGLWVLISFLKEYFPKLREDEIREKTLNILQDIMEAGLIEPGEPGEGTNFIPWESSPTESIQRIRAEWIQLGRSPILGDIAWLMITQKGLDLVRSW